MPQRQFLTTIEIDAPIERAWNVLVDFPAYAEWCPTHREIRGEPRAGARLRLRLAVQPGKQRTLAVGARVRAVEPPHRLAFGGGVPGIPALLDIHHEIRLERLAADRCRLVNEEIFRGWLLTPLLSLIEARVGGGYPLFNEAFRRRCCGDQQLSAR